MKQCCELLFEAGEQEKAISLAPAVSKEFWQALLRRRAEHIRAAGPATGERLEALLPLHILDGSAAALDQVTGDFVLAGDMETALCVAQARCARRLTFSTEVTARLERIAR